MTVVRRPAYITRSCPSPGDDLWNDFNPSIETQIKSASVKQILEKHFSDLVQETKESEIRKETFNKMVSKNVINGKDKEALYADFLHQEARIRKLSHRRMKISDFHKIKLIGKGGFGLVYLVQDKLTHELFALKVLRKADIILNDQLVNAHTERQILSENNPYIVNLIYSFQDEEHLYLVLEYLCGGDLMTALIKKNIFTESEARFFCGEIVLALNSLHQKGYVHHDLKPDNILIGEDGHIKLTDFGLSTYSKNDQTYQIINSIQNLLIECSSPSSPNENTYHKRSTAICTCNYTAPELFNREQPTPSSDFWSLGVILYEMLFGHPPFVGRSTNETILKIVHWKHALNFRTNQHVSEVAIDLIKHLLCEPENRFDFSKIISHPFFHGFDFGNPRRNPPPLVPVLKNSIDTDHFDNYDDIDSIEEPNDFPIPSGNLIKVAFWNYSFKKHPSNQTLDKLTSTVL